MKRRPLMRWVVSAALVLAWLLVVTVVAVLIADRESWPRVGLALVGFLVTMGAGMGLVMLNIDRPAGALHFAFFFVMFVASFLTMPLAPAAYLAVNGRDAPAIVADERCVDQEDGGCQQQYRVSDARTEGDLGWLSCNKPAYRVGEQVTVRVDPDGRAAPALRGCGPAGRLMWFGVTAILATTAVYLLTALVFAVREWLVSRRRAGSASR